MRRWADCLLGAAAGGGLTVLMLPAYQMPGYAFDEGSLLAYPLMVLDGAVPHRDFETFYGPGAPWLLAVIYELFGATQTTERTVGLVYELVAASSLFYLCLPFGRLAAVGAVAIAGMLFVPFWLMASPTLGALAAALAQLALLAASRKRGSGIDLLPVLAGAIAGGAALLRPEFALLCFASSLPLLWGMAAGAWRRYGGGMAAGLVPLAIHAVVVGTDKLSRVVSDLVASGSGRRLPLEWTNEPGRLLVLTLLAVVVVAAAALLARRRSDRSPGARGLLALSVLAAGLLPYALSRLDSLHLAIAAVPALAAAPASIGALTSDRARLRQVGPFVATAAVCLAVIQLAPASMGSPLRLSLAELGGSAAASSSPVTVDGRSFRVPPEQARSVRRVVTLAERAHRGGARRLFVGPRDLRRTNINDMFLYYLLADFEPASYYVELNPQVANREGSGLARDLRTADLLILNHALDRFVEPNDSGLFGSRRPNQVVARHFCPLARPGDYTVLRRCKRVAAGLDSVSHRSSGRVATLAG